MVAVGQKPQKPRRATPKEGHFQNWPLQRRRRRRSRKYLLSGETSALSAKSARSSLMVSTARERGLPSENICIWPDTFAQFIMDDGWPQAPWTNIPPPLVLFFQDKPVFVGKQVTYPWYWNVNWSKRRAEMRGWPLVSHFRSGGRAARRSGRWSRQVHQLDRDNAIFENFAESHF